MEIDCPCSKHSTFAGSKPSRLTFRCYKTMTSFRFFSNVESITKSLDGSIHGGYNLSGPEPHPDRFIDFVVPTRANQGTRSKTSPTPQAFVSSAVSFSDTFATGLPTCSLPVNLSSLAIQDTTERLIVFANRYRRTSDFVEILVEDKGNRIWGRSRATWS